MKYRRIVVPLDGSPAAERAVPLGEEIACRLELPLHLVWVVDPADLPDQPSVPGTEPAAEELVAAEAMADDYLVRVGDWLRGRGRTVTTEVCRGCASRQILDTVHAGDLLVMADRGRGGRGAGQGSVAEGIAGRARVPILVVPALDA